MIFISRSAYTEIKIIFFFFCSVEILYENNQFKCNNNTPMSNEESISTSIFDPNEVIVFFKFYFKENVKYIHYLLLFLDFLINLMQLRFISVYLELIFSHYFVNSSILYH